VNTSFAGDITTLRLINWERRKGRKEREREGERVDYSTDILTTAFFALAACGTKARAKNVLLL
jgi:hypothetical protein